MTKEIVTTDAELELLMAELETQNAKIMAAAPAPTAKAPSPELKEPEPELEPEYEAVPEPVDLTRKIFIHNAEKRTVVAGTVGDLTAGLEEVEKAEALSLLRVYKAKAPPAEVAPEPPAASTTPDFVKKVVKAKPAPVKLDDVPDEFIDPDSPLGTVAAKLSHEPENEPEVSRASVTPVVMTVKVDVTEAIADIKAVAEEMKIEADKPQAGLKYYIDVDQFQKDTRVSDIHLDQCMIEQNSLRAYYSTQAAYAEAQASRIKARFEVIEATLYDKHRKEAAASGEKTTVQMVESAVKMDPRWLSAKNTVIEGETLAAINKGLVESLKDRKDMLVQMGADRRDEGKGAVRILAEQNERQDLRERALKSARAA